MKIAFTTSGKELGSPLDARFGRASGFLVYDMESEKIYIVDNTVNLNAAQGAGIQAAKIIAASGVDAIVTGHCGPKAYRALKAAGIKVYTSDSATIEDALEKYRKGGLTELKSADVEGHWA
jgi:predicted Fe-Mo cluster-binding NifX family protein